MRVPNQPGPSRRQFLQRAALLAAGTPGLAALLDACAKTDQTSSAPTMRIASPDKPVTWDIPKDNEAIADSLAPEKGATLQLYSYADYVSPDAIKSFQDKYGTQVAVSTFNDTDEAITKIRAGSVDYDVFFPSYDQIGKLVNGSLLRPLNHSYIPKSRTSGRSSPTPGTTRSGGTPRPTASIPPASAGTTRSSPPTSAR